MRKVTVNRLCVRGEGFPTDFSMKGFFYFQTAISALYATIQGKPMNQIRLVFNTITPERLVSEFSLCLGFKSRATIVYATFSVILCII